ncbi:DUF6973 domain-containing protein [Nocardia sp. NPDC127606]|uniref:DUF6973 domain-containing protein n=1 Tax=Nocardia sp. NPDC127606 TaxID=3345406 RepID=UPI00362DDD0D
MKFTVPQAQSLDTGAIGLQADLWDSQSRAIARTIENQNTSVDGSQDFWQGASGSGFRNAFVPVYQGGTDLHTALSNGSAAARTAQTNLQSAQAAVNSAVQAAKAAGYEVSDDGTVKMSQQSQQVLLASAPNTSQFTAGVAALQQETDFHTDSVKKALEQLNDQDEAARKSVEDAFSGINTINQTQNNYTGENAGPNEKRVCATNPIDCKRVMDANAKDKPFEESTKYFPDSEGYTGADDRRDACRHCIWMAMMTSESNEGFARQMADAHEIDSPAGSGDAQYDAASKKMDLYNNETGIAVGLRHDGDTTAIINECVTLARNAKSVPMTSIPDASQNKDKNSLLFYTGPA